MLGTPSDDLVHALKYEGWSELADVMGDAVARQVAMLTVPQREARVIVPVPTTAERLRSRGYNQAELLARRVARVCRLRLEVGLVRTGARASQTALTPHERRENVRGAFRPAPGAHRIRGARVVLVDDVLTTGATASEAASTLVEMGAASVTLATYARALATAPEKAE